MSSKLIKDNVKLAFEILEGLDITTSFVFDIASTRDYDFNTGVVDETIQSIPLIGVIEHRDMDENGNLLAVPTAKAVINKEDLNGTEYTRFDAFTADGVRYKIDSYVDNGYSVDFTGKPQ